MLLWPDGHYGPREIISQSEWTLERPARIRFSSCFGSRVVEFHFERDELVIENGSEKGHYKRVSKVPSSF